QAGAVVDVTDVSKGKGFQGGVKRWHYAGGDATHGSMFHRAPGGIGGSSFPSRVWKNQHFPGHMGNQKVTAKNLKVVKVDTDENLLVVRGSVPGPSGQYIFIRKALAGAKSAKSAVSEIERRARDHAGSGRRQSGWQEGWPGGTGGSGLWREGESAPAARGFAVVSARAARGHAQDQGQERGDRKSVV